MTLKRKQSGISLSVVRVGACPRCDGSTTKPKGHEAYCLNCGWHDSDQPYMDGVLDEVQEYLGLGHIGHYKTKPTGKEGERA